MLEHSPEGTNAPAGTDQGIVIVYEDSAAREHALRACERLAPAPGHFENLAWFSFSDLSESGSSEIACRRAADADVVMFAVRATGDFPHEVKLWIEHWANRRSDREGALVGMVVDRPRQGWELASVKEVYLRHIVHRTEMDYLAELPGCTGKSLPDSLDSYSKRAGTMTSILDNILHAPHTPTPPL